MSCKKKEKTTVTCFCCGRQIACRRVEPADLYWCGRRDCDRSKIPKPEFPYTMASWLPNAAATYYGITYEAVGGLRLVRKDETK
jgi:hypothetical protein